MVQLLGHALKGMDLASKKQRLHVKPSSSVRVTEHAHGFAGSLLGLFVEESRPSKRPCF